MRTALYDRPTSYDDILGALTDPDDVEHVTECAVISLRTYRVAREAGVHRSVARHLARRAFVTAFISRRSSHE